MKAKIEIKKTGRVTMARVEIIIEKIEKIRRKIWIRKKKYRKKEKQNVELVLRVKNK